MKAVSLRKCNQALASTEKLLQDSHISNMVTASNNTRNAPGKDSDGLRVPILVHQNVERDMHGEKGVERIQYSFGGYAINPVLMSDCCRNSQQNGHLSQHCVSGLVDSHKREILTKDLWKGPRLVLCLKKLYACKHDAPHTLLIGTSKVH